MSTNNNCLFPRRPVSEKAAHEQRCKDAVDARAQEMTDRDMREAMAAKRARMRASYERFMRGA